MSDLDVVRVVVADDHQIWRSGVRADLGSAFQVVGELNHAFSIKDVELAQGEPAPGVSSGDEADFAALRSSNLKTARAWAIKESLRELWEQRSRAAGERWWRRWYNWATRSRLEPVKKVAAMMKRHLPNVLTYFKHRITNAGSEAVNSVIQMLKKRAFGYRSFENFRTVVLLRCGGLSLLPSHPNAG